MEGNRAAHSTLFIPNKPNITIVLNISSISIRRMEHAVEVVWEVVWTPSIFLVGICNEFKLTTAAVLRMAQHFWIWASFRPTWNESLEWGVIFTQRSASFLTPFTAEVFTLLFLMLSGIFKSWAQHIFRDDFGFKLLCHSFGGLRSESM